MRMINFAKRNFKELIRDPLSLIFEIVLPLFLLFIFQQFNIPAENYRLENFTPSIILFGFSPVVDSNFVLDTFSSSPVFTKLYLTKLSDILISSVDKSYFNSNKGIL